MRLSPMIFPLFVAPVLAFHAEAPARSEALELTVGQVRTLSLPAPASAAVVAGVVDPPPPPPQPAASSAGPPSARAATATSAVR